MKKSLHLLLILMFPVVVHADDDSGSEHEDSELGDAMEKMNGAFRKLSKQVTDPKQNEASLALIAKMRKACEEAAKFLPRKIERLPAKNQAEAEISYHDKMKDLIDSIDELAVALKSGNNKEAVKIIDDLRMEEAAGHREFRPKKKRD